MAWARRSCFLRPLNVLCEHESYLKQPEIKAGIFRILCLAAKNHGQAFSASPALSLMVLELMVGEQTSR